MRPKTKKSKVIIFFDLMKCLKKRPLSPIISIKAAKILILSLFLLLMPFFLFLPLYLTTKTNYYYDTLYFCDGRRGFLSW